MEVNPSESMSQYQGPCIMSKEGLQPGVAAGFRVQ